MVYHGIHTLKVKFYELLGYFLDYDFLQSHLTSGYFELRALIAYRDLTSSAKQKDHKDFLLKTIAKHLAVALCLRPPICLYSTR